MRCGLRRRLHRAGTYDPGELLQIVSHLSAATGVAVPDLVRSCGQYVFERFAELYPQCFAGVGSAGEFLARVDGPIHAEVQKLYPDAELPRIECEQTEPGTLEVMYQSSRPLADFAEGLITACVEHSDEHIEVRREVDTAEHGTTARFLLVQVTEEAVCPT